MLEHALNTPEAAAGQDSGLEPLRAGRGHVDPRRRQALGRFVGDRLGVQDAAKHHRSDARGACAAQGKRQIESSNHDRPPHW